jgi:hypothetical protein
LVRPKRGSQPRARRINLAQVPALLEQKTEDARGALNGVRNIWESAYALGPSIMVGDQKPSVSRRSIDAEKNSTRYRALSGQFEVSAAPAYQARDRHFVRRSYVSALGRSRPSVSRMPAPRARPPAHPRSLRTQLLTSICDAQTQVRAALSTAPLGDG